MKKMKRPVTLLAFGFRNFLISFGFTAIAVTLAVLFLIHCRVETVSVENTLVVPQPTILDAANIKAGRHLYSLNDAKIKSNIIKSSSYVKSVEIERKLPSTLRILVEEYDLSYYIEYEGRYYLITRDLLVIEETTVEDAIAKGAAPLLLPKLKDPKIDKNHPDAPKLLTPMQTLAFKNTSDLAWSQALLHALSKMDFSDRITSVDISDPFDIRIVVSDKYVVRLGNEKDFEKKLGRVENALEYLSETMYALTGILHAEKDAPITFELTGTISQTG